MFGYFQHDICKGLERQDFFRFSSEFRQVIYDNIPTIKEVTFFDPPELQPVITPEEAKSAITFQQGMTKAVEQGSPVVYDKLLYLPFVTGGATVVAQIKGLDEYLLRKVGNDWLDGLGFLLLREFLLVKRSCVDSLTGLLSSLHLEEYLDTRYANRQGVMILVALYPKSSSSFQAKKYQHRSISLLKNFVENRFPLYYLGQSCFGVLCENCGADFVGEFAPSLVNYLKRERCARVHVASTAFGGTALKSDSTEAPSEDIMKKAWAALHVATKRGPFAFCNSSSLEDVANHPLAAPVPRLRRWFHKVTRKLDHFSLIQFDSGSKSLLESVQKIVGNKSTYYVDDTATFLLFSEKDGHETQKIAYEIIQDLGKKDTNGLSIKCGISSFPFVNFRKSELLMNCRKALCHAAFLKPGSMVICDAVSFNISGDIYYGEGDLVLAVKEYQRGLLLARSDGNLLNSLGVCYAQMNRHKMAVDCFQRACESRDDQFMALYNLGLEYQVKTENNLAIAAFSESLGLPESEGEEKARLDMSFQLALLSIEQGQYQQGLDLLLPWYSVACNMGSGEKAFRYLGIACYGIGKHRDAMKYLQQAMRYDEYDAEVLGLLGEIYLKESEGDDIGLRFCEKAVELSPDSLGLKLRLAGAQIQCGDFQAALKNLQPCLRRKKIRPAALVQRGLLAREQGQLKAAGKWFLKAESALAGDVKMRAVVRNYMNSLKMRKA